MFLILWFAYSLYNFEEVNPKWNDVFCIEYCTVYIPDQIYFDHVIEEEIDIECDECLDCEEEADKVKDV